jgi:hypothetical protein
MFGKRDIGRNRTATTAYGTEEQDNNKTLRKALGKSHALEVIK